MSVNLVTRACLAAVAAATFAALAQAQPPAPSAQQQPSGPANALQGFAQNRDQPVKIDAGQLEVRDKDKVATFSGNVKVVQGDTMMRSRSLAVFYDGEGSTANALTAAKPGPAGQQRIRRLEAKGGVRVCQNDQVATGDTGIFDMKANTVTLEKNVVLTKGANVLKGERLTVEPHAPAKPRSRAEKAVVCRRCSFPRALTTPKRRRSNLKSRRRQPTSRPVPFSCRNGGVVDFFSMFRRVGLKRRWALSPAKFAINLQSLGGAIGRIHAEPMRLPGVAQRAPPRSR